MPARSFLFATILFGQTVQAQSDTLFPNVSGSWDMTTTTWDWDGQNMNFEYWSHHLEYFTEPSVEEFGFTWGTVHDGNGPVGLLAVDSGRVYYRGTAFMTRVGAGAATATRPFACCTTSTLGWAIPPISRMRSVDHPAGRPR